MPEPLDPALARLRPLLADPGVLVRAVAAGRRRSAGGARPDVVRAQLRPVALKAGVRLQVTTTDGRTPTTRNHSPGEEAEHAVDELLAQPFGNWHVETRDEVLQLRVTKSGDAQVHRAPRPQPTAESAAADRPDSPDQPEQHDRGKRHLLDPGDPLFAALGADAAKRRQVDAFLRQLAAALPRALERAAAAGRPLRVVDLGCGNAYLTFAAHRYLTGLVEPGVRTLGVDVRADLVARNTRLAAELGLPDLAFAVGAIADADSAIADADRTVADADRTVADAGRTVADAGRTVADAGSTVADADPGSGPVDVVLALHACDTATDDALARAIAWSAPVVLAAPCCHHDVQRQLDAARAAGLQPPAPHAALVRHPILRERFADVLTDTFRAQLLRLAGYAVEVVEFVDSRHTPRNALLRATLRPGRLNATEPALGADAALAAEHAELAAAWHVRPALADRLAALP